MRKILFSILTLLMLASPLPARAIVQNDPILCGAIVEQTISLEALYAERSKNHTAIQVAQAAIATAVENVHQVEEKVLEYMANASGVMQNLNQIKRIAELVADKIPNNLVLLGKNIPSNIKGTAITTLVNKTVTETLLDIGSLGTLVEELVTSSYSFKKSSDSSKINLLSAAERYNILQDVVNKLDDINWKIYMMRFYIQTYDWRDLWQGLDRTSWCQMMQSKALSNQLINQWNSIKS